MPFSDFHGNTETVRTLREMLARDHFPHAVILSGPPGAGKFTLAQMIAKALNCENQRRPGDDQPSLGLLAAPEPDDELIDFCGHCESCVRIAQADDLQARVDEAVEAREALRETDKK